MNGFLNQCPKCQEGAIFSSMAKMNATCVKCGYKFEKEQGYFLGAMSFSYVMGFLIVVPVFLFLLFNDYHIGLTILIPFIMVTLLSPILFRFSRLIWIYMDNRFENKF